MCHGRHAAYHHRRRFHFTDWHDLNASFCWRFKMTGLSVDWFLLWGLSGWLSILVSGGLVVPTTVEMQTALTKAFEDVPEISQGVASAGRSSHDQFGSGTKATERLQSFESSPGLVTKRDSSPFPIQNHSSTPGFGVGRTYSPESSDPTFKSASRSLISTPAQPPEPSKTSIQSTEVPIQNQKTPGKMSSTAKLHLSSLTSTPDPLEPPRTSSIPGSKGHSTPIRSPSSGFGTTVGPARIGSLKPIDLSATRSPISSPEPLKPASSSSVSDSTPVPIHGYNVLSGFGTTGNTPLTGNASLTRIISTPKPPESPRTSLQSTLVPIQNHKTPPMTSLASNSNLTSLLFTPEPTRSSNATEFASVSIQSHSSSPGFRTPQKTSLTGNTDITKLISTLEPPEASTSTPVTSQSSPPAFGTTVRIDTDLTSPTLSATRSLSSTSASPTTRTSSIPATTPTPCAAPKTPPISENQSCSPRDVVKPCLVAIACLAALATIFMVSTIILCAKLSNRKYKLRKSQDQTEMMFMSALLPETNYAGIKRRSPVSNGVLVIHSAGDSDEDISDNLTLSSFLPESDRCV